MQWLQQIKDLLETNITHARVKKFIELLAQEIPIILKEEMQNSDEFKQQAIKIEHHLN